MANLEQAYAIGRAIAVVEATLRKSSNLPNDFVVICIENPMDKFTHHLGVFAAKGERVELMSEIMDDISPDALPSQLNVYEKSRAWVGYYHQKKALYEKNGI